MIRSLYLLRHAKADRGTGPSRDLDRPLTKRGRKDSKRLGRRLEALDEIPEHVLVSPAIRARETISYASCAGDWEVPVEIASALYDARIRDILEAIDAVPSAVERLLVCGHQPVLSEVIARLVGGSEPVFPTGACARIDEGRLVWLVTPKLLA